MSEEQVSLDEVKKWADDLLDAVHVIATGPNKYKSTTFARIVEASFRRDYLTLSTIRRLSDGKPEELIIYGSSCMDLFRRVFEDLISLEYMIMKGKDDMAKKFRNFLFVEDKKTMEYLESGGVKMDPKRKKEIEDNYEKVKKDFFDKSSMMRWKTWLETIEYLKSKGVGITNDVESQLEVDFDEKYPDKGEKVRKSWAGLDVENMVIELAQNKVIQDDEVKSMLETYRIGNSKNHFSPTDLINYLYEDLFNNSNTQDIKLSLLLVTMNLSRISSIAISELDFANKAVVEKKVDEIWGEISKAHLPSEEKVDDKATS